MWAVDLTGFKASAAQLYVAAISAAMLGLYAFTLPACPPMRCEGKNDALRFRTGCTGAVQAQEDGHLLPILHVAGSRPSNNKHLW